MYQTKRPPSGGFFVGSDGRKWIALALRRYFLATGKRNFMHPTENRDAQGWTLIKRFIDEKPDLQNSETIDEWKFYAPIDLVIDSFLGLRNN